MFNKVFDFESNILIFFRDWVSGSLVRTGVVGYRDNRVYTPRLNLAFNSCFRFVIDLPRFSYVFPLAKSILRCTLKPYLDYRLIITVRKLLISNAPVYIKEIGIKHTYCIEETCPYLLLKFGVTTNITLPATPIFPHCYWKNRFFFTFFRLWGVGPPLTRCSLIPFLSNEPLVRLSCAHMYRSPRRVFTIEKQNASKFLQIYFWTLVQNKEQNFNILKFSTFLFLVKIWNSFFIN